MAEGGKRVAEEVLELTEEWGLPVSPSYCRPAVRDVSITVLCFPLSLACWIDGRGVVTLPQCTRAHAVNLTFSYEAPAGTLLQPRRRW